ncbi:hypothetical protein A5N82_08690 [Christensenella minuta]|nr:hypothetical protein B1H56_08860 [Christensenella minuta]OAQ37071.1 hypothetical protein A5N82_08690 [Christensenella minuta]
MFILPAINRKQAPSRRVKPKRAGYYALRRRAWKVCLLSARKRAGRYVALKERSGYTQQWTGKTKEKAVYR